MDVYSLSDSQIQERIGHRLKSVRLRRNITQAKLAFDARVSLSSVKKVEKGEIGSFDTFIRLLRILGELDLLRQLTEELEMSPNEYYEFVYSQKRKKRLRATTPKKTDIIPNFKNKEPEW